MLKTILFSIILFTSSDGQSQLTSDSIIGIWQDASSIASGWSENYRFFDDGTFIFSHNQMDCADSIISQSGTFKVKKYKLFLRFNKMNYIAGGKLIKSTGSCGSEYELTGGVEKETLYKGKSKVKLSIIETDPELDYLKRMKFDNYFYWRMANNPNSY